MSYHDLPNYLTAKDISAFTNLNKRRIYDYFDLNPEYGGLPNFRVGKSRFSKREDFVAWWEKLIKEGTTTYEHVSNI